MALEANTQKVLEEIKDLVEKSKEQGAIIKQELDKIIQPEEESENEVSDDENNISEALSNINLSRITKLRKFLKGENFSTFCERFKEYVYITKMKDSNLYIFFLQNVDDETYSELKTVPLSAIDKQDPSLFCKIYKKVIYGDQTISLKNEVMECKQKNDEKISDFAYRLREKANIAFANTSTIDENCLLAFIRGVKDAYIKRKLNESTLETFNDAITLAKRLERVENMLDTKPDINSILKQNSNSFQPSRQPYSTSNQNRHGSSDNASDGSRSRSRESGLYRSTGNWRYRELSTERYPRQNRFSNRRDQNNNWSRNPHQAKTCWRCGLRGHVRAQCKVRRNNYPSQSQQGSSYQRQNRNSNGFSNQNQQNQNHRTPYQQNRSNNSNGYTLN